MEIGKKIRNLIINFLRSHKCIDIRLYKIIRLKDFLMEIAFHSF